MIWQVLVHVTSMGGANLGKVEAVGDSFLLPYKLQTKEDSDPPGKSVCVLWRHNDFLRWAITRVGKKSQNRES